MRDFTVSIVRYGFYPVAAWPGSSLHDEPMPELDETIATLKTTYEGLAWAMYELLNSEQWEPGKTGIEIMEKVNT